MSDLLDLRGGSAATPAPKPARFPAAAIRAIPLGPLRCARCEAAECTIFVTSTLPITAFCGPRCAAAWGVWPWKQTDEARRAEWPEPAPDGSPANKET